MLSEKQIKEIEELTGFEVSHTNFSGDEKMFSYWIRFSSGENDNLTIDYYTDLNGKIAKFIKYHTTDYYGLISSNKLPIKWLAPLAKILEEK